MSDALVSPTVFIATAAVSATLLGVAIWKMKQAKTKPEIDGGDDNIIPLMGVMGAFIFVAQMVNFSIPGTGSSGHLVGGILLAALLGPWAGFITLASVLVLQCLIFADGGFLALGANIFNMAVMSCLVAYPLVFRPLMRRGATFGRILWVSLLASIFALGLGALAVTIETEASGITALPMGRFLMFMLPIHLLIALGEGLATAAVVYFVQRYKPELLHGVRVASPHSKTKTVGKTIAALAWVALFFAGTIPWVASSDPDGLEWSISQTTGQPEIGLPADAWHQNAAAFQQKTAFMPGYNSSFAGLVGAGCILLVVLGGAYIFRAKRKEA